MCNGIFPDFQQNEKRDLVEKLGKSCRNSDTGVLYFSIKCTK